MSGGLLAAAFLLTLLAFGHSILGERYILTRLFRRTELPRLLGSDLFTRRTLRFAWHLTSVAWLGFAALLVLFALPAEPSRRSLLLVVAGTVLVHAVVTLAASRGRHLAWIAFAIAGVLAWLAA
jgi:hypothetical protein